MIKDLLKTMLSINNDTQLNPNEKVLLSSLILYYNSKDGYAYPNYEELMIALSTNRKAKVSITLKSLVAKEYITIKKVRGNKSTYYIHKHLFFVEVETEHKEPVKEKAPVAAEESAKVIEIAEYTGFNKKQSSELLAAAADDKAKVINAFEYAKSKNAKDQFNYTKWAITNNDTIKVTTKDIKKDLKFNNFEPREYNYDNLEKKLLGWDDDESVSIYA